MEGHIRKRGKTWSIITFEGRDPATGRKRYRWRKGGPTRATAAKALRELLKSKDDGTFIESSDLTVAQFLDKWLADARARISPKTYERYHEIASKNLIPALGSRKLAKLAPLDLSDFYAKALASGGRNGRPLSPRTVLHFHRVLSAALRQAVRWNLVARNVAEAAPPPKVARREIFVLDEKQTGQLLEAARGHALYTPCLLAVTSGLRRGELLGLRWSDVTFDSGALAVSRSLEETKKGLAFKSPKSGRARVVKLPQVALGALRRHRAEQTEIRLRLGPKWNEEILIFPNASGEPWRPSYFTDSFSYLARRAKLAAGIHFHSLRHSAATQLLKANVHPKIVSERLGHSKIGITLDLYSHALPDMQQEAADKIDAALAGVIG